MKLCCFGVIFHFFAQLVALKFASSLFQIFGSLKEQLVLTDICISRIEIVLESSVIFLGLSILILICRHSIMHRFQLLLRLLSHTFLLSANTCRYIFLTILIFLYNSCVIAWLALGCSFI